VHQAPGFCPETLRRFSESRLWSQAPGLAADFAILKAVYYNGNESQLSHLDAQRLLR